MGWMLEPVGMVVAGFLSWLFAFLVSRIQIRDAMNMCRAMGGDHMTVIKCRVKNGPNGREREIVGIVMLPIDR